MRTKNITLRKQQAKARRILRNLKYYGATSIIARHLGVSHTAVSLWVAGRMPSARLAREIPPLIARLEAGETLDQLSPRDEDAHAA